MGRNFLCLSSRILKISENFFFHLEIFTRAIKLVKLTTETRWDGKFKRIHKNYAPTFAKFSAALEKLARFNVTFKRIFHLSAVFYAFFKMNGKRSDKYLPSHLASYKCLRLSEACRCRSCKHTESCVWYLLCFYLSLTQLIAQLFTSTVDMVFIFTPPHTHASEMKFAV